MTGLVPVIHVEPRSTGQSCDPLAQPRLRTKFGNGAVMSDVDARHKAGQDDSQRDRASPGERGP